MSIDNNNQDNKRPTVLRAVCHRGVYGFEIELEDGQKTFAIVWNQAGRYYFKTGTAIQGTHQRHYLTNEEQDMYKDFCHEYNRKLCKEGRGALDGKV